MPTIDEWVGHGWALFSPCQRYRYALGRQLVPEAAGRRVALWCMLNPSTADAQVLDPTIRRCCSFSASWGCTDLVVVNVFAWRSTDPHALADAESDPVGPDNDQMIARHAMDAHVIVAAWGAHQMAKRRVPRVVEILRASAPAVPLQCLGVTNTGAPKHPLYLPSIQPLVPFIPR